MEITFIMQGIFKKIDKNQIIYGVFEEHVNDIKLDGEVVLEAEKRDKDIKT